MSSEVLVSKEALLYNLNQFRKIAGEAAILSVIKSEAYGHGMELVAKVLRGHTDWFGTVSLEEALRLREAGIKNPIVVLSFYDLSAVPEAVRNDIALVVYRFDQAQAISRAAKRLKVNARIHLKVDTGTSRLGVLASDFADFASKVAALKNLEVQGVMSHFSSSEEDLAYTEQQLSLFEKAIFDLEKLGIRPALRHIACTAAGLELPKSRKNLMRVGIGTYGLWPSELSKQKTLGIVPNFDLCPALTWKTKIVQVKELESGSYVGYGKSFVTKRRTKLAVLPIGYFDGYDRKLSNAGSVLIAGKRCPVIGRICMNLSMVDATNVPNVTAGDEAVLLGRQGKEEITAEELAKRIGTINYEVVARINPLIKRKLAR